MLASPYNISQSQFLRYNEIVVKLGYENLIYKECLLQFRITIN